jgi:GMP synthase-like glutamine amidotransferase
MTTNALQAVLDRAAAKASEGKTPEVRPPTASAATPQPRSTVQRRQQAERVAKGEGEKFFRPARVGKRFVGAHFHPEVARQLKMLAAEDDRTIQELLEDAVDLLFVKAGKAKIAELVKNP